MPKIVLPKKKNPENNRTEKNLEKTEKNIVFADIKLATGPNLEIKSLEKLPTENSTINAETQNTETQESSESKENVEKTEKNPENIEKTENKISKKNPETLINLSNLSKYYDVGQSRQMVLKGLDIQIQAGEIVAILGKSGSGKSTLLNILGLLDHPTGGSYELLGQNIRKYSDSELSTIRARTFGFIFQQFNLLPRLSVLENILLPMRYANNPERWRNRLQIAQKILKIVEIEEQAHKLPKLLSGGQQQRVAIARSLINNPKVVIGDEPTGALDSKTADQIVKELFRLNKELGVTLILVTHDEDLAAKCPRTIRLVDGLVVG